jgi:hypothetical protein
MNRKQKIVGILATGALLTLASLSPVNSAFAKEDAKPKISQSSESGSSINQLFPDSKTAEAIAKNLNVSPTDSVIQAFATQYFPPKKTFPMCYNEENKKRWDLDGEAIN